MKRSEGMHFYINIPNFNAVVIDEEVKNGKGKSFNSCVRYLFFDD